MGYLDDEAQTQRLERLADLVNAQFWTAVPLFAMLLVIGQFPRNSNGSMRGDFVSIGLAFVGLIGLAYVRKGREYRSLRIAGWTLIGAAAVGLFCGLFVLVVRTLA